MKYRKLIWLTIAILLIGGVVMGAIQGASSVSEKYARTQVESLRNGELEGLYDQFTPELQNSYSDVQDFVNTVAGEFVLEPIESIKHESQQGSFFGGKHRYHLVREDDASLGYTLDIEITSSLFNKKIKDITLQPARFHERD